jgi:GNAT superfamily N-acetyltransferase
MIQVCPPHDIPRIAEIINESAQAYKGVIPVDRWHVPYMSLDELKSEIFKGVRFYGWYGEGGLAGVMGIQNVKNVTLIRHAYVLTASRQKGIGGELLSELRRLTDRPILIGTWRAASWAVAFYRKNGFELVTDEEKNALLRKYWTVPERQIEESVVLADERWRAGAEL